MDLTTLDRLKAWFPSCPTNEDPALNALITRVSAAVEQFISRHVVSDVYVHGFDGTDGDRLMLREYPVTELTQLLVDGTAIAPSLSTFASGWRLAAPQDQAALVGLIGRCFSRGFQNVQMTYRAGYLVDGEERTVAATVTPNQFWRCDIKIVAKSNGQAMTKVASAPASGQYSVATTGVYSFNGADVGQLVLLTYGTVPPDIEQAVLEACVALIQLQVSARDPSVTERKAGDSSEKYAQLGTLSGAAIGTILLTPNITSLLSPYRRVAMF